MVSRLRLGDVWVHHSCALSAEQLKPWAVIQKDGTVLCGHCTCQAGLGEVCSHVTAMLYALEAAVRHVQDKSCTDGPRQWGQQGSVETGKSLFAPGTEIDFTSPARKRTGQPAQGETVEKKKRTAPPITAEQTKLFYETLKNTGLKPALLSVLPGYCQDYIPKQVALGLPKPLPELLYKPEHSKLSHNDLMAECEKAFSSLTVTEEQAEHIERETRLQAKAKLWFSMREGRITASMFKDSVRTNPASPAKNLIRQICYPQAKKFATEATQWGCDNEERARQCYVELQRKMHTDFKVEQSGLQINPAYPFLGASPDGLVSCACCGDGLLEIKCPFSGKDVGLQVAAENRDFCLELSNGIFKLRRDHRYYYQVQAQLFVTDKAHCDFVVWCTKGGNQELFIERIAADHQFFSHALAAATTFYKQGILPELLAKAFTSPQVLAPPQPTATQAEPAWCYCKATVQTTDMLRCHYEQCQIKLFHLKCLGLKNVPRRKWLCHNCRVLAPVGKTA
ncbi:uncharacterized protein LOC132890853 isoform X2 [Neoarius graeffei]|uniref:uncharacterized protein LOC132890853 isoform X2 n=1 Tax=Neoarius graeffei TaxID=443677 RepID=UPI00298D15B1|nr:uncharacterized protein LOC132890853 isoform X2 [Neoarius graeffei]